MPVRPIHLLGDPILRTRCAVVRDFGASGLTSLITDLRDTLDDFRGRRGFGRGIAAPQIGITQRVIVIHITEPCVLINPVILRRSTAMFSLWDDCFSFPDLLVRVKRHQSIEVRFADETGERHTLTARGALSELLQHEIDHLNGVLAIDRAIDSRHIVLRSVFEALQSR